MVISPKPPTKLPSALPEYIYAALAEKERALIAERTRLALARKKAEGAPRQGYKNASPQVRIGMLAWVWVPLVRSDAWLWFPTRGTSFGSAGIIGSSGIVANEVSFPRLGCSQRAL